jgi:hypothetical protein
MKMFVLLSVFIALASCNLDSNDIISRETFVAYQKALKKLSSREPKREEAINVFKSVDLNCLLSKKGTQLDGIYSCAEIDDFKLPREKIMEAKAEIEALKDKCANIKKAAMNFIDAAVAKVKKEKELKGTRDLIHCLQLQLVKNNYTSLFTNNFQNSSMKMTEEKCDDYVARFDFYTKRIKKFLTPPVKTCFNEFPKEVKYELAILLNSNLSDELINQFKEQFVEFYHRRVQVCEHKKHIVATTTTAPEIKEDSSIPFAIISITFIFISSLCFFIYKLYIKT